MDIRVFCTVDRNIIEMKVQKTGTVLDVKTAVMEATGIPIADHQLIFKRRNLLDDDPLSLYKIKKIVFPVPYTPPTLPTKLHLTE